MNSEVRDGDDRTGRVLRVLSVLVPRPGTPAGGRIDPGSGVVTADATTERVQVYYEGNRYGAENLRTFEARVFHAAGRLASRYPTVACGVYDRADFAVVGTCTFSADWRLRDLVVTDAPRLAEWMTARTGDA